MTPEERARSEFGWIEHTWPFVRVVDVLAAAIREAIAEEREACAQIAKAKAWGTGADDLVSAVANLIATQIRSRGSSEMAPAPAAPTRTKSAGGSEPPEDAGLAGSRPRINCEHCGMAIALRNPSGYCDHLHHPDYCALCRDLQTAARRMPESGA